MKIVVVMPTYNEAENIQSMIPILLSKFKEIPAHEIHLLVVDGNSPDGTAKIAQEFARAHSNIHVLLEKEKSGLGAAYIYGFKYAIFELNADAVIEMDADFQHDPNDLTRLIVEYDNGYDYVIGSRYLSGIAIPKEWAFYRKFLSVAGNLFTKVMFGMFNVTDFTSGFKLTSSEILKKIDLNSINSKGFSYKMEILYKAFKAGAKIKEIPIIFGLRDRGDSKMDSTNAFDSLKLVTLIRMNEHKSFLKFIIVGFGGLFIDSSIFNILRIVLTTSKYSSLTSGLIAMLFTYTMNNFWSFGERKKTNFKSLFLNFILFSVSSYIPIIFRSYIIKYAEIWFGSGFLVANIAFFIGIAIGLVWNFTVYSRIIWRKK